MHALSTPSSIVCSTVALNIDIYINNINLLLYSYQCYNVTPQEVQEGRPALFLFAMDAEELRLVSGRGIAAGVGGGGTGSNDGAGSGGGAGGRGGPSATQWLLVAWIPDDSKVGSRGPGSLVSLWPTT